MTKPNYTHIHVLFDRTGSMAGRENDVNGWYKVFFAEQKTLPGECTVSVAQFDSSSYDVVIDWSNVKDIPDEYKLVPRSGTNLRDSLAKSINTLGEKLAAMKEEDRPSKVLVVVHTDGEENSSVEWTQEALKELVKKQREDYKWEFTFLGADIDAFTIGTAMGFSATSNLSSGNNTKGYATSAFISTTAVSRWRTGLTGSLSYTEDEVNLAQTTITK